MKNLAKNIVLLFVMSLFAAGAAYAATWQNVQLLNISNHTYAKTSRVWAASTGGFHSVYKDGNTSLLYYRRYQSGALGSAIYVGADYSYGTHELCQAGNGDIWVTWERWYDYSPLEQIYAARSTNGGVNWNLYQITNYNYPPGDDGEAKNPEIVPIGSSSGPDVISLSWRPEQNYTYHNRWNGSSFTGNTQGWYTTNSYAAMGSCRSLADGSVYRCYGKQVNGVWHIAFRRFDGTSWGSEILVSAHTSGFACRPDIAVNGAGQVLVVWDVDNMIHARFYDPSSGWGPDVFVEDGFQVSVTAIPGRNDFYMVYSGRSGYWDRCYGRRFLNGTWYGTELVGVGLGYDYIPDVDISAGPDGMLYAVMEHWGTGNAQQYYTSCSDFVATDSRPAFNNAYVSSSTLIADGSNQYTVTLQATDPQGINDIKDMRVMFNYNNDGQSTPTRGYLAWGQTQNDITYYGGSWDIYSATGGGYWGFYNNDWGYQYISPVSCTTSTSGNQRTVNWTFRVQPAWGSAGPYSGNYISMWSRDGGGATGWLKSTYLFSYTFNVQPPSGAITGNVKDGTGANLSGATVSTTTGGYTTTTNSSGNYTLSNVTPGTYSVVASKSGYNSHTQTGKTVNSGATTTVNFTCTRQTGAIAGNVKDNSGANVSGATVSTTTGGYTTTTNSSGNYTLSNVATGTYDVVASKTGYNPQTQTGKTVNNAATTTVNFTITAQGGTELVQNGTMEGGFFSTGWASTCSSATSKLPNPNGTWGWNNDATYPFNTFDATNVKHAGSHSLGFAFCQTAASPGKMGIAWQSVNLGGSGVSKTFTVWAYHTDGNCPSIMCWNPGISQNNPYTANANGRYQWVTTDNWGQRNMWVTRSMTVTSDSSGYVTIMVGGAAHPGTAGGAKLYIDDVSVQ